jgi:hypothetical protein
MVSSGKRVRNEIGAKEKSIVVGGCDPYLKAWTPGPHLSYGEKQARLKKEYWGRGPGLNTKDRSRTDENRAYLEIW